MRKQRARSGTNWAADPSCHKPHPFCFRTFALPLFSSFRAALSTLTVWDFIRPLPFLINNYDDNEDNDFCQDPQKGPERSQVAADAEDGGDRGRADLVGCVALVLAGILVDL